jgi:hypothetical protein
MACATSSLANNADWNFSIALGKMFDLKKYKIGQEGIINVKEPKILELDLVKNDGLGLMYLGTFKKAGSFRVDIGQDVSPAQKYDFHGIYASYQNELIDSLATKLFLGYSYQSIKNASGISSEYNPSYGISSSYKFNLDKQINAIATCGYLKQDSIDYPGYKNISGTGLFCNLGISSSI